MGNHLFKRVEATRVPSGKVSYRWVTHLTLKQFSLDIIWYEKWKN